MQVQAFERRVEELVQELANFSGFRTLWLDAAGRIGHAEPDEELEAEGWTYLCTVMRPTREALTSELIDRVPIELGAGELSTWQPTAMVGAQLLPAGI